MPRRIRLGVLILLVAAALGCGSTRPAPIPPGQRTEGLTPFVLPWDDSTPGPTNISDWSHRPAGEFGHLHVGEDGHIYARDERIRFLGVNVCFSACFPEKLDAEKIAARMAKFGINVVRFHHMDHHSFPGGIWHRDGRPGGRFDPESLDRLDYFIAKLKEHGIYVNLNLLVSRRFTPRDGLPEGVSQIQGKLAHLLACFHEPSLELQKQYATDLLTHRNPYTGMKYTDDPAVAFVEINNENGLINYWFSPQRKPHLHAMPEPFNEILSEKWNAYLKRKYQTTEALAVAWRKTPGRIEDGSMPLFSFAQVKAADPPLPVAMRTDWVTFLWRLEQDYFRAMSDHIRKKLGAKALVTGTTCASSTANIMASTTDVIDSHVYWDNPRWRGGTWHYAGRDWHISNTSHVSGDMPGGKARWIAMSRVAGMPFSVTEYNHSAPNVFAGEAPIFLAAFASIQDWDAIYLFAYSHKTDWDRESLMGLDIHQHPTKMANMPIAAALFRRGDIPSAARTHDGFLPLRDEPQLIATKGTSWNLATGYKLGLDGDEIIRRRIQLHTGHESQMPEPPNPLGPGAETREQPEKSPRVFNSDGGRVKWHVLPDERAYMVIDTPRTKAVLGSIDDRRYDFGPVQFRTGWTIWGGGTLSLTVLEGETLAQPRRALLVATASVANTDMKWKAVEREENGKTQTVWELDSWGKEPTVIEPLPAEVAVACPEGVLTVYALDENGQRGEALAVDMTTRNGRTTGRFEIGKPNRTLWYELVWHAPQPAP